MPFSGGNFRDRFCQGGRVEIDIYRSFVIVATACATLLCGGIAGAGTLPETFACGKEGVAGGLGTGTDLTRYTVNVARYPEAVCNDGTPAVFYYGAATRTQDRDNWIIFLQGGGACTSGQKCAERWCSIDSNYGLDKMSSSLTKPQIRGAGFLSPASQNRFGTWNRVLIFYCSSDTWAGTSDRTLEAALNGGDTRQYQIHFKGSRIVDAVLDTLRNAGRTRRRAVRHASGGGAAGAAAQPWPDLDDAVAVLFAGSSGGGAGVRANLDRVGTKLRGTNPDVDFRGLIDAIYGTLAENLDFSKTTYCASDPLNGCAYDTFTQGVLQAVDVELREARGDASCPEWHAQNGPGTEWRCGDGEHLIHHHLSTPFFVHMDMQDTNIGGAFVEAGFGTASDFATRVANELRNLQVPEEPRGAEPGLFVPQCTDHESFTNNSAVFDVRIGGFSYHDVVSNWWDGTQPQKAIRPFTGSPGPAPECPPQ